MAIGTPSAELVRATRCEGCNREEPHVRRRHVAEAGTTAEADRFLCTHCAGGMVQLGHSVVPFTARDRNEYDRWINAPRALSVLTVVRLQESAS